MPHPDEARLPDEGRRPAAPAEPADHGVSLVSVVVALAVLGLLVVGIFWGLPLLFGSGAIHVTVRQ
jgi:hypothetical protein